MLLRGVCAVAVVGLLLAGCGEAPRRPPLQSDVGVPVDQSGADAGDVNDVNIVDASTVDAGDVNDVNIIDAGDVNDVNIADAGDVNDVNIADAGPALDAPPTADGALGDGALPVDAGADATLAADGTVDAGADASVDASVDAGADASVDGGGDVADASADVPRDAAGDAGCAGAVCGGRCVDLQYDPDHCGACGQVCPSARVCEGGVCRPGQRLAGGNNHSCALRSDGTVWCWGSNETGQIGDGTLETRRAPVQVMGLAGVVEVGAGDMASCALRRDGAVFCWGLNRTGEVGDGSLENRLVPTRVLGVDDAVELGTYGYRPCARTRRRGVVCWGGTGFVAMNDLRVIAGTEGIVALGRGSTVTCGLDRGGSVLCWGNPQNNIGQWGSTMTPLLDQPLAAEGLSDAVNVEGGVNHSCALRAAGTLVCWGYNNFGQVGNGRTATSVRTPTAVINLTNVVAFGAGFLHSCAVLGNGRAFCWGTNFFNQSGVLDTRPVLTPTEVAGLDRAVSIAVGGDQTCALRDDLSVWCWGGNRSGQLGDNSPVNSRETPGPVAFGSHNTL
ncbi:MAG: hypothetical protein JNK72_07060 [Myxococcales bacterium]|nr:hypothetical protein [Myxococcales bacterium]